MTTEQNSKTPRTIAPEKTKKTKKQLSTSKLYFWQNMVYWQISEKGESFSFVTSYYKKKVCIFLDNLQNFILCFKTDHDFSPLHFQIGRPSTLMVSL